jgi:hypothetical protein
MKKCKNPNCNKEHDGSYGCGNFCSFKCSRGGGLTEEQRKNISEIIKNSEKAKRANELRRKPSKQPKDTICEKCGNTHNGLYGSGKYCSRSCANSRNDNKSGTKLILCIECGTKIKVNKRTTSKIICTNCKKKENNLKKNIKFVIVAGKKKINVNTQIYANILL